MDVLFGRTNPAARLPVTIPNEENEVGFTEEQYPGVGAGPRASYSEELLVGYKWYAAKGVEPKACFGHGLSYTTFAYSNLTTSIAETSRRAAATAVSVEVTVTNSGALDGEEVAQLYLAFPDGSGEPPLQLRAFSKPKIRAGESAVVAFELGGDALSIWDEDAHAFYEVSGTFGVAVGPSSCDLRLKGEFESRGDGGGGGGGGGGVDF